MKRLKLITSAFFVALSLFLSSGKVIASEGTVELQSQTAAKTSCFASSVMMQNFQYRILVSCQNLVYPAPNGAFAYILWANPAGTGTPFKLGSVGFGKAQFTAKTPFTGLFLTSEVDDSARTPSQFVVAKGSLTPLTYQTDRIVSEPVETVSENQEPAENFGEIIEEATPTSQLKTPSTNQGLLAIFEKGGVAFAVGVFIVLIILAFITRARG